AYDVRGGGKSKFYGSFGTYYDVIKYLLPLRAFGGQFAFNDFYTLDTLNIGSIGHGNYPGEKIETTYFFSPPANVSQPLLGGINLIDPNLKPMRTRDYAAGYERTLGHEWTVYVRYTRKRLDRAIEDMGVFIPGGAGATFFTGNPGEGTMRKA